MSAQVTYRLHPVESALFGVRVRDLHRLLPGVLVSAAVAWAAGWLAEFIGLRLLGFAKSPVSDITLAIVLGLLIRNSLGELEILQPGISFAVKKVLRLGIILMGMRLSMVDVLQISLWALPLVLVIVGLALYLVWAVARRLDLPERLGILTAVGTSICGVSAIVSTAPAIDATDEEVSYAVANITLFGLLAMLIYPFVAPALFAGNSMMTGLWLGTAIHDTAQATAAGLMYDAQYPGFSPTAGEIAVVAKLVRNTLLAAVIPLVSFVYARRHEQTAQGAREARGFVRHLPAFVLGFLLLALLRTLGDTTLGGGRALWLLSAGVWADLIAGLSAGARMALALAMAGVGLGTSFQALKKLGARPFLLGLASAGLVGLVSAVLIGVAAPLLGA